MGNARDKHIVSLRVKFFDREKAALPKVQPCDWRIASLAKITDVIAANGRRRKAGLFGENDGEFHELVKEGERPQWSRSRLLNDSQSLCRHWVRPTRVADGVGDNDDAGIPLQVILADTLAENRGNEELLARSTFEVLRHPLIAE